MRLRVARATEATGSGEGNNKGEVSMKAKCIDDVALVCMLLRIRGCPEFKCGGKHSLNRSGILSQFEF